MSQYPRCERAVVSVNHTLDFLSCAEDYPSMQPVVSRMQSLLTGSDYLTVLPYDDGQMTGPQETRRIPYRDDGALLPPSAVVFQALPADKTSFPVSILATHRSYETVIHKAAAAVVTQQTVQLSVGGFDSVQPLISFANLGHPLPQAIAGIDAYSRLMGNVDQNLPIHGDISDAQTAIGIGVQTLNCSQLVANLLQIYDPSGVTSEWLEGAANRYADALASDADFEYAPPPDNTELAEAVDFEPITPGIIYPYIMSQGMRLYGERRSITTANIAYAVAQELYRVTDNRQDED